MLPKPTNTTVHLLIGAVILAAIVVGVVALMRSGPVYNGKGGSSKRFAYDLNKYMAIDPALIRYRQTAEIDPAMKEPRAVAVGPDDRIHVVGDELVRVFDSAVFDFTAKEVLQIALDGRPQCLAVGGNDHAFPARIYVGMREHVEVYSPDGIRQATWRSLGDRAVLTSIATDDENVFLADAGNKIILCCNTDGKVIGRIGRRDPARNIPGFVIPSPYFDVAMARDGLLRAVNPGGHRIEAYTPDGHLEFSWGKPTVAIEGFCGCCNPVNIAILPDGHIVTAEKGIPRVKIYTAEGRFACVVAGPDTFLPTPAVAEETRAAHKLVAVDLAADSRGRVLVLDPATKKVRVFERSEM